MDGGCLSTGFSHPIRNLAGTQPYSPKYLKNLLFPAALLRSGYQILTMTSIPPLRLGDLPLEVCIPRVPFPKVKNQQFKSHKSQEMLLKAEVPEQKGLFQSRLFPDSMKTMGRRSMDLLTPVV